MLVSFSPSLIAKYQLSAILKKKNAQLIIEDEGPGFNEKNIDKFLIDFIVIDLKNLVNILV